MSNSLLINLSFLFSQPTGISNYALNLVPYLKNLNPTLLTANKFDNFNCYSIANNLSPEYGAKGHFRRLLWTQFQLPSIYKSLKSNLVFSPVPEAPLYRQCRYVVMVHDLIPLRFPQKGSPLIPYFRYYIPQVLKSAEHIICNSHATAKDIIDFWAIPSHKITPILLGYNSLRFCPLNLPTLPYFLYIGRHDPYKNLSRLIDSFAKIGQPDYQLWLVGSCDDRYTPQLQQQAESLGIKEQVKFFNYLADDQLPIVINQATALVFPSLWEGFGLPVLEAMACGIPVITSNISSLPEVTQEAGILVDPLNIEEIAAAMRDVANDSQLRSHLCDLSLRQASKFSWAKTGEATATVLQNYL